MDRLTIFVARFGLALSALISSHTYGADSREIAFIANSEAGTVALLDVASKTVIGAIDTNPKRAKAETAGRPNYAQDTDVSPDGRTLFVSRGYLGDVAAFDVATGKMLWERSLVTGRADHMTITADGKSLFVSAIYDNRVYKLSAATGEIQGHVVTGVFPHDVKVSRDGKRLYNTSLGPLSANIKINPEAAKETPGFPFQITVADAVTLKTLEQIKVEAAFRPWQFSANEATIYTQLSNEHVVARFDVQQRKIVKRLALPVKSGITSADFDFEAPHHGLALTDDGKTLCLAGRASDYVALVSTQDLSLIATIPAGDAPGWSEVADGGLLCIVPNTRSDDLSIISIADRKEIARVAIGDGPKHVTVAHVPNSTLATLKQATR
jgi:DNA-binding beta-propeller fold protein YncE